MKNLYILFFLLMGTTLMGQTEQGNWMLGGRLDTDLSLDDDDDATLFELRPSAGKFLLDNLAFGATLGVRYDEKGENSTTTFELSPFARWYILGGGDLRMFLQAEFGYLYQSSELQLASESSSGFGFFGGPGLSFFFSDQVSLDVQLGYNYRTFGENATSENIRLLAGFQIFL